MPSETVPCIVYLLKILQVQSRGIYMGRANHRKHWEVVIFSKTSPWIPDHPGFAAEIYFEYVTVQVFSLSGHGSQEVSRFPSEITVPLHMYEVNSFPVL